MTERGATPFERHFQTVIQIILVGIGAWIATTTQTTSVEVAKLTERVASLSEQVKSLEAKTEHRYTSDDAVRDFAVRDKQIEDLRTRVRGLESDRKQ